MERQTNTKKFSIEYLKNFLWDSLLILVLIINMLLICWNWLFSVPFIYEYFKNNCPDFFAFYNPIYLNEKLFDLIFVSVYIIDVIVSWSVSIFKDGDRWYKYPLRNWYDILGCIPTGTLVFLRLFRVVSIIIRLYKKGLIDFKKLPLFHYFQKIYNIIVEEISDRVVLNILGGIKNNVQEGLPIANEIINKIVIPHKKKIIELIFDKIQKISRQEYAVHKDELANYITQKSCKAVKDNQELSKLSIIPVVGSQIRETLERSVSKTVVSVVDNLINDLLSNEGKEKLSSITNKISDDALENLEDELSTIVTDIVSEVVNIIARTTNVKQWKLNEMREQIKAAQSAKNPNPELIEKLQNDYKELYIKEMQKKWETIQE